MSVGAQEFCWRCSLASHKPWPLLLALAHELRFHACSRFRDVGLWALADGRRFNGTHHPRFHAIRTRLSQLIEMHPQQLGWGRSRWSCELLSHQLAREFSSTYHPAHISRVLASLGIRRVVPRMSIARQPWDHREQAFRLFEKFVGLPQGDIVLFADEVDIHLNPKCGPVLARAGHRPTMETPGANTKRYLAGAYNQVTGHLVWVRGKRKASELFIELCEEIASRYRGWGTIHLVVDNYGIHSSKKTNEALEALGGKIVLHFLPSYSPEYNVTVHGVGSRITQEADRCAGA